VICDILPNLVLRYYYVGLGIWSVPGLDLLFDDNPNAYLIRSCSACSYLSRLAKIFYLLFFSVVYVRLRCKSHYSIFCILFCTVGIVFCIVGRFEYASSWAVFDIFMFSPSWNFNCKLDHPFYFFLVIFV